MSTRSMMADLVGMLCLSSVVCANAPRKHRFRPEKAGEGLLIGREALAKAHDVPVEHIHFLPRGQMTNSDNMTCIYSISHV